MSDREEPTGDVLTTGGQGARPDDPAPRPGGAGRGQALLGVLAGVVVVAVTIGVFVIVRVGGGDEIRPAAVAPAPTQSAAQPPAGQPAAPGQQAGALDPALQIKPVVKAGTGQLTALKVETLIRGRGPAVTPGQVITVNYVGVQYASGKQFDSSWGRGQPAQFPIGTGNVIEGWDRGLVGVPVGSRVQLDIPAAQAYGEAPPAGAPKGALRFVVDILAAQS